MATAILRLRVDPVSGKRELVIDYTSDSDALPVEHEEQHRALASKVVDGGLRSAKLDVSRATEPPIGTGTAQEPAAGEQASAVASAGAPTSATAASSAAAPTSATAATAETASTGETAPIAAKQ